MSALALPIRRRVSKKPLNIAKRAKRAQIPKFLQAELAIYARAPLPVARSTLPSYTNGDRAKYEALPGYFGSAGENLVKKLLKGEHVEVAVFNVKTSVKEASTEKDSLGDQIRELLAVEEAPVKSKMRKLVEVPKVKISDQKVKLDYSVCNKDAVNDFADKVWAECDDKYWNLNPEGALELVKIVQDYGMTMDEAKEMHKPYQRWMADESVAVMVKCVS